jgi:hypothetical protein
MPTQLLADLWYKEGNSDKVYKVWLETKGQWRGRNALSRNSASNIRNRSY